ncbi:MAG: DUF4325 domain-containing protein [Bacteroidaceae bacterium]|nr:DUF4325 domain-containing protein [Bacteroidaceae bacterium]
MSKIRISLSEYSPLLSSKEKGDEIYRKIQDADPVNNLVELDLTDLVSMATYCAKQIFGKLYIELGAELFFAHIKILNASENLKLIIRIGINSAIDDQY